MGDAFTLKDATTNLGNLPFSMLQIAVEFRQRQGGNTLRCCQTFTGSVCPLHITLGLTDIHPMRFFDRVLFGLTLGLILGRGMLQLLNVAIALLEGAE